MIVLEMYLSDSVGDITNSLLDFLQS